MKAVAMVGSGEMFWTMCRQMSWGVESVGEATGSLMLDDPIAMQARNEVSGETRPDRHPHRSISGTLNLWCFGCQETNPPGHIHTRTDGRRVGRTAGRQADDGPRTGP